MKIHACLMTQNEIEDLVPNITSLLPYVDSVTIVDGGSNPNTFMYLRNWSNEEPKIRFFLHKWEDNFPKQRNNYLKRVAEIAQDGDWLLSFDADEYIMNPQLMRGYIDLAEKNNKNMIGFQCRSVSLKGDKRVWENDDRYWKHFLRKWNPNMKYAASGTGTVHEHIIGVPHNIWEPGNMNQYPALVYEHRKQENIIWLRGARNMWIGGGGANGNHSHIDEWRKLRNICATIGIDTWHQFYEYMLEGNILTEIKNWMIIHRQDNWGDGSSEFRELFKTYMRILHPEEEPEEFRNEYIP